MIASPRRPFHGTLAQTVCSTVAERTDSSKTSLSDSGMTGSCSLGYMKRGVCRWLQAVSRASPITSMKIDMADTRRMHMGVTVPDAACGRNEDIARASQ